MRLTMHSANRRPATADNLLICRYPNDSVLLDSLGTCIKNIVLLNYRIGQMHNLAFQFIYRG
jgi:hypothetical protein